MSLEYELNKKLARLLPVLDEYTEWFGQILRYAGYPQEDKARKHKPKVPSSFYLWGAQARQENFQLKIINALSVVHDDLVTKAESVIAHAEASGAAPPYTDFDELTVLFEEFVHGIRRLEKDFLLGDRGIDYITGLRTEGLLDRDYARELDRTSRQGKPFAIALIRIDCVDVLKAQQDKRAYEDCLKVVANMIKKSIRSFDDAYRLGNDEILVSLKQTGMAGAVRALERLKSELKEERVEYQDDSNDNEIITLTLSSCIAEPVFGDDLQSLLSHLREDLSQTREETGSVLEYFEVSPLERFVSKGRE